MKLFALVPVKPPHLGKSRLAAVLSAAERQRLNMQLATQTIEACAAFCGAARTFVITPCGDMGRLALQAGAVVLREGEAPAGLNGALAQGAAHAMQAGAEAIIVVPTDLPLVCAKRLAAVASALPRGPGCVLVPDRRGSGTNVLALTPVRTDVFRFGMDSSRRHSSAAQEIGYALRIHLCDALCLDLDVPEDLETWAVSAR